MRRRGVGNLETSVGCYSRCPCGVEGKGGGGRERRGKKKTGECVGIEHWTRNNWGGGASRTGAERGRGGKGDVCSGVLLGERRRKEVRVENVKQGGGCGVNAVVKKTATAERYSQTRKGNRSAPTVRISPV